MLHLRLAAAALAVVAPLLGPNPGQDSAQDSGRELERLATLVSELEAFELTLHLRAEGGEEVVIELRYQAPDRARLVWTAGDQTSTGWYLDGVLHLLSSGAGGASHARFDAREFMAKVPSVHAVLAAEFPELSPGEDLGPGPVFHMEPNLSGFERGAALVVTLSFARSRPALFCWGFEHRARLGPPEIGTAGLLFGEPDGMYFELSSEHGFPIGFRASGSSGAVELIGVELDREPEFDDASFEVPSPAADAQDVSAQSGVIARRPFTPQLQRIDAWESLFGLLARGVRELNDDTRERCGRVFTELHSLFLPRRFAGFIDDCRETSESALTGVERDHGDHPPEDIAEQIELLRADLENSMGVARERFLEPLAIPEGLAAGLDRSFAQQLLELELEAAGALFESTVSGPILADFEQRALALGE